MASSGHGQEKGDVADQILAKLKNHGYVQLGDRVALRATKFKGRDILDATYVRIKDASGRSEATGTAERMTIRLNATKTQLLVQLKGGEVKWEDGTMAFFEDRTFEIDVPASLGNDR
jgi:hypothetical protein